MLSLFLQMSRALAKRNFVLVGVSDCAREIP